MPPVKRPHAERPYLNAPLDEEALTVLREFVVKHGLRGTLEGLATVYREKAKSGTTPPTPMVRAALVLEAALDGVPLQVR